MFRQTLNFYIAWQFLLGIATAFVTIESIIILIDFVEISRTVGARADVGFGSIAYLTLLKAPKLIEEIIPFVVLFGVMSALNKLNKRSELIVLRAVGLSAWRFLLPGLIVAGLLGCIWAGVLNPLASKSVARFDSLRAELLDTHQNTNTANPDLVSNLWLREGNTTGQTVIHSKKANIAKRELTDVTFYIFKYNAEQNPVFSRRYDAKTARLEETGYWVLTSVVDSVDGKPAQPYETLSAPTNFSWSDMKNAAGRRDLPQFWNLPKEIKKTQRAGFSATPYIIEFHSLLALPLTLIAMAVLAAVASMRLSRLGGTLRLMVTGAALGFAVYFSNNMVTAFGETGALPAILSAWSVPVFVLLAGLTRLCTLEDG